MLRGAVAASTARQYKPIIVDFRDFCRTTGNCFPYFTEQAALHYVATKVGVRPLGFFNTVSAALGQLQVISGRQDSAITCTFRAAVEAVQRDMAARKPPVKKAKGISFRIINVLLQQEVAPHMDQTYRINPYHFRSLFRGVVCFFTLARFEDFSKLTDADFQDNGDHILVTYKTRKNDQFGDNSAHAIPVRRDSAVCPVRFVRAFFFRFQLRFAGPGTPVNFRFARNKGVYGVGVGRLCRSNATKYFRDLMQKHGFDGAAFSEKSFKVGGVTALLDAGEPLENVQMLGGWKSAQTVLYYRNASLDFKVGVASRMPLNSRGQIGVAGPSHRAPGVGEASEEHETEAGGD